MGLCRFCGKPAGFLRKEHRECREKYNQGVSSISSMIASSLTSNVEREEILKIASDSFINETKLTLVDQGILCITNKNIYFGGKIKSFRIPYNKIVSFTSYSDGIGIHRDSVNAKLEAFSTNDGWFTYNLLVNLASKL